MKVARHILLLACTVGLAFGLSTAWGQGASTKTIPPGATTSFSVRTCGQPEPFPPCLSGGFWVTNRADHPVAGSFDMPVLTLIAPAGFAVQILSGCLSDDGPGNVVHCRVSGLSSPPTVTVTFTVIAIPVRTDMVRLVAGCNNVTLTWPTGTPAHAVAVSVAPSSAFIGIWRFDSATQRFQGFSPLPGAPNDFAAVNRAEPAFLCMQEPGTLVRPAIEESWLIHSLAK